MKNCNYFILKSFLFTTCLITGSQALNSPRGEQEEQTPPINVLRSSGTTVEFSSPLIETENEQPINPLRRTSKDIASEFSSSAEVENQPPINFLRTSSRGLTISRPTSPTPKYTSSAESPFTIFAENYTAQELEQLIQLLNRQNNDNFIVEGTPSLSINSSTSNGSSFPVGPTDHGDIHAAEGSLQFIPPKRRKSSTPDLDSPRRPLVSQSAPLVRFPDRSITFTCTDVPPSQLRKLYKTLSQQHISFTSSPNTPEFEPEKIMRILTLDGGGSRGVVSLYALAELEKATGKRVHELFDLIVATSTGCISATLLTIPNIGQSFGIGKLGETLTALEAIEVFKACAGEIFPAPSTEVSGWSLSGLKKTVSSAANALNPVKYSVENFTAVLNKFLGDTPLSSTLIPVAYTCINLADQKLNVHSTSTHPTLPIKEAILAATAASTLFAPVDIDGKTFVDAGLTDNNPSSATLRGLIQKMYPNWNDNWDNYSLCSLGTGKSGAPLAREQMLENLMKSLPRIVGITLNSPHSHKLAKKLCQKDYASYYRFDVKGPSVSFMEGDGSINDLLNKSDGTGAGFFSEILDYTKQEFDKAKNQERFKAFYFHLIREDQPTTQGEPA